MDNTEEQTVCKYEVHVVASSGVGEHDEAV
jgi:hypothetical protein